MGTQRFAGIGGPRRGAPALAAPALALAVAVAVLAAMAGSGPAAAAAGPGSAGPPRATPGAGVISTVAGGVGGPAKATHVSLPAGTGLSACGVAFGAGRLYIANGQSVRAVNPGTDWLTTPAGTGVTGPLGDGGRAAAASLQNACGPAVDRAGNLVIADSSEYRVRVVAARTGTFYGIAMTARDIYTIAGDGKAGFSGDGGPATSAELKSPSGVAVDAAGSVLIADPGSHRVRAVAASTGTFYGVAMTAGNIYTVAGNGKTGSSGDGGAAISARLNYPAGVAVDAAGNLLIADVGGSRIRVVAASNGRFYGRPMTAGDIYTIAGSGGQGFSGDGGPATKAELGGPESVAVDAAGNVLIPDTGNNRVRVVAARTGTFYGIAMTARDIYTIAGTGTQGYSGDGGPATSAELRDPAGVTADASGNVVIGDTNNDRVRVLAASTGTFYGIAMTAGNIYTVAGDGPSEPSGDGAPATRAELTSPGGVAADAAGNLLIADSFNCRIQVAAASTGTFYGQSMTAGHIYTIAGNGTFGFAGDGGPATRAELAVDYQVAVDAAGNVLIPDGANNRIRVVAASTGPFYGVAMTAGHIYTIAGNGTSGSSGDGGPATSAELSFPDGVAADAAGNLLIADTDNDQIRVVAASTGIFYGQQMTAGDIYTINFVGFPFLRPSGVATDAAANVLIADTDNNRVRVLAASTGTFYGVAMTAGGMYTIAGNGTSGFAGDGGPATSAELSRPSGVTLDAAGNVLIPDTDNNRVRVVAASTGTFYGQAMNAGDIYTIVGTGTPEFAGDGGPATSAALLVPEGLAVDAAGNLLIADSGNNRIRMVTG